LELSKLILVTSTLLGSGFILANLALSILLAYQILQVPISSAAQVTSAFGTVLFLVASVVLIILGVFMVLGGVYFYRWGAPEGIISLGILLGSLYVLFLGIGSALLQGSIESFLLTLSGILFMAGSAAYLSATFDFKLAGSLTILAAGVLLAAVLFRSPVLGAAFAGWDVPFPGPFMCMSFLEGIIMIFTPSVVFADLIIRKRRDESTVQVFFPIITLVYGMGMFIGTVFLMLNLWNLLWKAPWLGPLYNVPHWVSGATVFYSVTLIILAIAGIFLGVSSFLAFANMTQEMSIEEGFSQIKPSSKLQHQFHRETETRDEFASLRDLISSSPNKNGHLFTARKREEEKRRKRF